MKKNINAGMAFSLACLFFISCQKSALSATITISDGHSVVYYPHLIVHSEYQGKGIGQMIVKKMQEKL